MSGETLSDIAVFVSVVKHGSFTAAADNLQASKSQVSKCVNRLEQVLGARLLHRTTRRLRLTEAGSALYDTSASALAAIEDAQLAVSNLQGAPRGTLKVSASTAFGVLQLVPLIAELSPRYPELRIELALEDRHVDLVREGIDLAVRITGDVPDSGMIYRRLATNRQVVCASPGYLQRHGMPQTLQDLAGHKCIAHTQRETPRIWTFTTPDGGQAAVQIDGRVGISTALGLRQAALDGLGIVELNSYIVGDAIESGHLVRLLEGYRPKELSIYAVYPQRRYLAPKVRVFIDALLARMTPEPVWDRFLLSPSHREGRQTVRSPRASRAGSLSRAGNGETRQGDSASRRR